VFLFSRTRIARNFRGNRGARDAKEKRLSFEKKALEYLYIIAVFLYRVRRGEPPDGWPRFFV
jgi:hypothetical protein